jgi:hypothetical protein
MSNAQDVIPNRRCHFEHSEKSYFYLDFSSLLFLEMTILYLLALDILLEIRY